MTTDLDPVCYHLTREDWLRTPAGDRRGYIQPQALSELWFHTGTICNLRCPFCLEGSQPGDTRLEQITFEEAREVIDEAMELGVDQFSFTGGEPFVTRDMVRILDYALEYRPCLVLTNGTKPLARRMLDLVSLREKPHPLRLRVSLDYPDPARHDEGRGPGAFATALATLQELHRNGFVVSVARQMQPKEDTLAVNAAYLPFFDEAGLSLDTHIVPFPDFMRPGSHPSVPQITENCMTTYHTAESRGAFMCSYTKMIVKKAGRLRVYACTLVDDDEDYDLGGSLTESMKYRVMLKHHRCFSCFAYGASCSESKSR